ncbi:MAG: DUF5011 domain-containing protein, partial [Gammaproteobacteria bacterium]|nr:DUF5011 domain-containing protein [Gammaproteobacteria bacterium]NNJ71584.1 DUF5011 domain-containing protein [Enterobacterales bacterium]
MTHRILPIFLIMFLTACGGGGGGDNTPNPPPVQTDTTAPVITLNGDATVNHEQGTTYVDAGATATDNVDGTVSVTTTGTVGTAAGTYTLTYTATDAAGNSATATREVIVADTTPPTITITGGATTAHEQGTTYTDAGATATDVVDGNVDVTTSGTVGATAGDYTITYSATDAAGNSASADRTVTVADTTPPAVTLTGESLIVLTEGDTFTDPGATADDLVDGNVAVTTSGTVDTNTPADYILTYSATDLAGNTGSATRTIRIEAIAGNDDITVLSQGIPGSEWDLGLNAFDSGGGGDCRNDGGAGCPNISWTVVT